MNTFDISKTCIDIAKSEVFFQSYRMALNRYKYDIEVQYDGAIKRNKIYFDLMQQMFNPLDG